MTEFERNELIDRCIEELMRYGMNGEELLDGMGFPPLTETDGGSKTQACQRLGDARDLQLTELDAFLLPVHPADGAVHPWLADEQPAWDANTFRLFISHQAESGEAVSALSTALKPHGVHGFVAHMAIEPDDEWVKVIEGALRTCDALVVWLTPKVRGSAWCDQEVGIVIGRGCHVLSVKAGASPYGFISKFQAVNGARKTANDVAAELATLLRSRPRTMRAMARASVFRFIDSGSYDDVRSNWQTVTEIPPDALTDELRQRLAFAHLRNGQIRDGGINHSPAPSVVRSYLASL